jgi:diguanylate cyclase (GGDEF)-like protein
VTQSAAHDQAFGAEYQSRELGLVNEATGLLNGDALFFLGDYQLRVSRRTRRSFAILYIVVEDMKKIAESFGPEGERRALRETAELLLGNFRTSDVCAHLGGGEFCVLLSEVLRSWVGPQIACFRLLERLDQLKVQGGLPFRIEIQTGVAGFGPEDDVTLSEMVARARDQARKLVREH